MSNKIAYCPWCGRERTVLAFFPRTGDMEWEPCNTLGCKGSMIGLITNDQGFIIHPKHMRGRYVYAKPLAYK